MKFYSRVGGVLVGSQVPDSAYILLGSKGPFPDPAHPLSQTLPLETTTQNRCGGVYGGAGGVEIYLMSVVFLNLLALFPR